MRPLSAEMSRAARDFSKRTGKDVWTGIAPRRSGERKQIQSYVEEPEHYPGIERFMQGKLAEEEAKPPVLKILTRSFLGKEMPVRLFGDEELLALAKQEHKDRLARYGHHRGHDPDSARALVQRYYAKFKQWLPEYFRSINKPELAQKYADKLSASAADYARRGRVGKGEAAALSPESRKAAKKSAAKRSVDVAKIQRATQKQAIDRDAINLQAFPDAFVPSFTRKGSGFRPQTAAARLKLAMVLIHGKLEGKTLPAILKEPEAKGIVRSPGFFRTSRGNAANAVQKWWNGAVLPVVKATSPTLHHLLTVHYKTFKANYLPLSQSAEIVTPE
jgi:hypothetical protein